MKGQSKEAALVVGVGRVQRRLHAALNVERRSGQQSPVLDDSHQPVLLHHEQPVGVARRADAISGAARLVATGRRKREMFPFVIAGRYLAMVTCTGAEVAVRPRLSVATAVSVCVPSARLAVKLYGLAATLPSSTAPSKN